MDPFALAGLGSNPFEENYPTCSPDLGYCPDNVCDPLEEMGYRENIQICPQDCVLTNDVIGLHHVDHSKSRGIHMSASPCTCRATGQCDCTVALKIKPEHRKIKTKATTSTSTTTEAIPYRNGTTGASSPAAVRDGKYPRHAGLINGPYAHYYLLSIVIGPMLAAVLLVSCCFRRKNNLKKKLTNGNSIPMNLVSNDTEVLNVDLPLNSRINDISFKIDVSIYRFRNPN